MIQYNPEERNVLLDEFLTPVDLIEACFEQAIVPMFPFLPPEYILDIGSNTGGWGKVARKHFPDATIVGAEVMDMGFLPDGYNIVYNVDFITTALLGAYQFDLIIGNLPFTVKHDDGKPKYKAEDFVRKAFTLLTPFGKAAFLLRSNFRHSIERYWLDKRKRSVPGLFQTNCPCEIRDFTLRPSFYREDNRTEQVGTKATNAHDNALFIWWQQWDKNFYTGKQLDWNYKE